MKLHFVEAHAKDLVEIPKKVLDGIPEKICIATDVQFINQLDSFESSLKSAGKEVFRLKGAHARHLSQILGCSHIKLNYPKFTQAFLYIGDGFFHPKALLLGSEKDVYIYNPFNREFKKLSRADTDRIKRKEKAALLKFLHSGKVGILIAVKPGQMGVQAHLEQIYSLEKKYPDKKFYYLAFDTLDFLQLGNFPFIEVFVNTACTRLVDDIDKFPRPMVNIDEILKLGK